MQASLTAASLIPSASDAVEMIPALPFYYMPDPASESRADRNKVETLAGLAEHQLTRAAAAESPEAARDEYRRALISAGMALLITRGVEFNGDAQLVRELGRLALRGAFPGILGAYAAGHYSGITIHRLPTAEQEPEAGMLADALRATRRAEARSVRAKVQTNEATAIRCSRSGQVLSTFEPQHWEQITWRLGYTSLINVVLSEATVPEVPYAALTEALTAVLLRYVWRWLGNDAAASEAA